MKTIILEIWKVHGVIFQIPIRLTNHPIDIIDHPPR